MDQKVLDYVVEKTHELMNAPSCSKEAKQAAQNWLDAIGTDNQLAETKKYIAELEADIMPIDGLIAFANSEMAKNVLAHAQDIKAKGAKHCDCSACKAVADILAKKEQML